MPEVIRETNDLGFTPEEEERASELVDELKALIETAKERDRADA